jgi:osmoprotectant transport system permease protein
MEYLFSHLSRVFELFVQHLYLVGTSLLLSALIAIPLGIFISRHVKLAIPVLGTLGVLYTIPSLALFALIIPILGLGFKPAVAALVMYSQMILVRNTVAAIRGIEPTIIEAAKGMGMGKWRVLWKIELPLALPVIIAGVRIALISMIAIASVAAYINAGGLGVLIFEGIAQDHSGKITAGTIVVACFAIVADFTLRKIERGLANTV